MTGPDTSQSAADDVQPSASRAERAVAPPSPTDGKSHISLTVDYGDGTLWHAEPIAWQEDLTVAQLWRLAAVSHPDLQVEMEGGGSGAFLHAVQGRVNGQTSRNDDQSGPCYWQFWHNGVRSPRGMGITSLRPGDRVLWKFTTYD